MLTPRFIDWVQGVAWHFLCLQRVIELGDDVHFAGFLLKIIDPKLLTK